MKWTHPAKQSRRQYKLSPCNTHMSTLFLVCASQQESNGMLWLCKYHALDSILSLIRNGFGYSVCYTSSLAIKSKYKHRNTSILVWATDGRQQLEVGFKDTTPDRYAGLSYVAHVKSSVSPTQQDGPCSPLTPEHRRHHSQGQCTSQGKAFR